MRACTSLLCGSSLLLLVPQLMAMIEMLIQDDFHSLPEDCNSIAKENKCTAECSSEWPGQLQYNLEYLDAVCARLDSQAYAK